MIDILVVNYKTIAFLELLIHCLKKYTSNSFRLIICDNGSNLNEINGLKQITKTNKNIILYQRKQKHHPSYEHGKSLDKLIQKVKAPYFAVFDADATILCKDWDVKLINILNQKNAYLVGSPAPLGKRKFTSYFVSIFKSEVIQYKDFMFSPKIGADGKPLSNKDTGWSIEKVFKKYNLKAVSLDAIHTRKKNGLLFKKIPCSEYYHPDSKEVIGIHFGRGSNPSSKTPITFLFLKYVKPINKLINKVLAFIWIKKIYKFTENNKKLFLNR